MVRQLPTYYIRTECGETFNGTSGDIYSPNWGNGNYHGGHDCTWTVEVPAGSVIKAELLTFNLDASLADSVTVGCSFF